jgi:hypothetical protein
MHHLAVRMVENEMGIHPQIKVAMVQEDFEIVAVYANHPDVKIIILDTEKSLVGQKKVAIFGPFESDGVVADPIHELWDNEYMAGNKRHDFFAEELKKHGF